MKHLKMLGLAVIAALGLMAFAGDGAASATTLSTDAAGTAKYAAGTEIDATLKSGTSALLEKTNGERIATNVTSTIKGKIGTATGTWVSSSIETLTWDTATQTTDTINNGSFEIMQSAGDQGEVITRETEVTQAVFGVSCTYGAGAGIRVGIITGGASPELPMNAILPRTAGSTLFCPSTGRWTATYIVTSPHEVHIVG